MRFKIIFLLKTFYLAKQICEFFCFCENYITMFEILVNHNADNSFSRKYKSQREKFR